MLAALCMIRAVQSLCLHSYGMHTSSGVVSMVYDEANPDPLQLLWLILLSKTRFTVSPSLD
jgi:hypothetical protein